MGWPKRRSWFLAARGKIRPSSCVSMPTHSPAIGLRSAPAHDASCRVLVGCGENLPGQRILIVDPQTHVALSDGQVGEIWVQGPSVACGYFENEQATADTFQARLADGGDGPFLRTGDLGFMLDSQLFVTGRLKNLIIIRGRNHYPEDIEQTINSAYEGLRVGQCAAFSIEVHGHEQLVVVQEVEPRHRDLDTDAAIQAIRTAIANRHELEVYAVVLVKAGTVPKTSSGKTRRAACREKYLEGDLEIVAAWKAAADEADVRACRCRGRCCPAPSNCRRDRIVADRTDHGPAAACAGRHRGDDAVSGARHGLVGRGGDRRRFGALVGTAFVSDRNLQLSDDRGAGRLAGDAAIAR